MMCPEIPSLMYLQRHGNENCFAKLMDAKANLLQETSSGCTAMWEAASHNQISMITCILRHDTEYTIKPQRAARGANSCPFLVGHPNQVRHACMRGICVSVVCTHAWYISLREAH